MNDFEKIRLPTVLMVIICISCTLRIICAERTQKATITCLTTGINKETVIMTVRLFKNQDDVSSVNAVSAEENDPSTSNTITNAVCKFSGNGNDATPFQLAVTFQKSEQNYPCGIVKVSDEVFRLRFRTYQQRGASSTIDAFYDGLCNSALSSQSDINISPTDAFSPVEAKLVKFDLLNDQHNPVSSVNLGDRVYLRMMYYFAYIPKRPTSCGRDFWFALPQNIETPCFDKKYLMIAHSHSETINVTLTDSTGVIDKLHINLPFDRFQLDKDCHYETERTTSKAVRVTSTHDICIHSFNFKSELSSNIFTLYPSQTLGTEYVLNKLTAINSIVIVSTEANTDIHLIGDTSKLSFPSLLGLNMYESVQIVPSDIVNGLRIVSSRPVALFVGSKNTSSNFDTQAEQIWDITKLGTTFIFIPGAGEIVCTSVESNTKINYTGTSNSTGEIQENEIVTFKTSDTVYYKIQSSKPLMCGQYFQSTDVGQPKGYAVVPSVIQWSAQYTFGAFVNKVYLIIIIIRNGFQDGIEITGTIGGSVQGSTIVWTEALQDSGNTYVGGNFTIQKIFGPVISVSHATEPFLVVFQDKRELSVTVPPGIYLSNINPNKICNNTSGYPGDLIDNDCDGKVDEDLDVSSDSTVYDLKGIAEGVKMSPIIYPVSCIAKPDNRWSDGGNSITMIESKGCLQEPVGNAFLLNASFISVSSNSNYTQKYKTGYMDMARFSSSSEVYIRCQILLCNSTSSEDCFQGGCSGTIDASTFDTFYTELKVNVSSSSEQPIKPRSQQQSSTVSSAGSSVYIPLFCAAFAPLILSLIVTLFLYKKLVSLINETLHKTPRTLSRDSIFINSR